MNSDVVKVLCMPIIFIIAVCGGCLVFFVQQRKSMHRISMLNCACGGILLSAGLCHLLAETDNQLGNFHGLNIAHFLAACGFFVGYGVEKVFDNHEDSSIEDLLDRLAAHIRDKANPSDIETCHTAHSNLRACLTPTLHAASTPEHHTSDLHSPMLQPTEMTLGQQATTHHTPSFKFPITLFVVLCCENLISGAALGSQTERKAFVIAFVAIASHIWAGTLTVAVAIWKRASEALPTNLVRRVVLRNVLLFSAFCPTGIAIGMALKLVVTRHTQEKISAVLLALAAGAFVFIAIAEVMATEIADEDPLRVRGFKFCMVVLGFLLMTSFVFVA